MDWHKGETRAENFYPRRGRGPKKFAGNSSKTALFRSLQRKIVDKYVVAMLDTHNVVPGREETLRDLDDRQLGLAVERMQGEKTIENVERIEQKSAWTKEPLINHVRRQRLLAETDIPAATIARISNGEMSCRDVAEVLCRDLLEIEELVDAYRKENCENVAVPQ